MNDNTQDFDTHPNWRDAFGEIQVYKVSPLISGIGDPTPFEFHKNSDSGIQVIQLMIDDNRWLCSSEHGPILPVDTLPDVLQWLQDEEVL